MEVGGFITKEGGSTTKRWNRNNAHTQTIAQAEKRDLPSPK